MIKDIVIYGAGGYGREVDCIIHAINSVKKEWNLIGFFDDGLPIGDSNEYGTILGGIEELNNWKNKISVVIAIGNPPILKSVLDKITNSEIDFPNIIAPDILFLDRKNSSMGHGNVLGFRTGISCNVHIGCFNNFNVNVFLGHDTRVGNYNMFNPSVRISGEVIIGSGNFLGVNSIVLQRKKIGNWIVLGANSVIIRKTKDCTTYIGNPAIELNY
jgi:sugar O-acyltransferase (sialic acid O-acetyltransferase NeuD family)